MINNTTNFGSYRKNINNHEDFINNYEEVLNGLFDKIYPVGCLYWSSNSTNPSQLFGGTWKQITDKFIYAAGSKAVNATGGEETHILTTTEIPAHNHSASASTTGSHTHTVYRAGNGGGSWDGVGLAGSPKNSYAGYPESVQANGNHTHTITVNNSGGSTAHNNMPPYLVKYCWERTG